ncbi:Ig-like domain-containing protein, partial [Streptomyces goshikiensis]
LTATVTATSPGAGTPTGTITFKDGGTTLGTGTLVSGIATFTVSSLSVNPHTLTAAYGGDINFDVSASPNVTYVVAKAATSTVLTAAPSSSVFGQSVTLTATVTATSPGAGTPTGTVTFKDGGTTLGTVTLVSGVATFTTSTLTVASHTLTAAYTGDTNFTGSTSPNVPHAVAKAATVVTLSLSPNPLVCGQSVTICATVTAVFPSMAIPAGNIVLTGPGGLNQTVTLDANGKACIPARLPASGIITAAYSGSTSFTSSTGTLTATVTTATSTLTASPAKVRLLPPGFLLPMSATLTTNGNPEGKTITFRVFGALGPIIGTAVTNASGVATLAAPPFSQISVAYAAASVPGANYTATLTGTPCDSPASATAPLTRADA